jgi:hypothetical protein
VDLIEVLIFLILGAMGYLGVVRVGLNWAVAGVWLNFLWLLYQNELGSGWNAYLRGVGIALVLAISHRQYVLTWVLLPWPLLLYTNFQLRSLVAYGSALGEGMMLGLVLYLFGGWIGRAAGKKQEGLS